MRAGVTIAMVTELRQSASFRLLRTIRPWRGGSTLAASAGFVSDLPLAVHHGK